MEKPEDAVTPERATSEETRAGTESKPTAASPKTSWIEVLVDPRTLQGLMLCGGGLLVLGLVTWLWAIGVFANKLVVASCLGVANAALLAVGLAGARYSRYQTASRAVTMLACLVMPLNLWFYDAQGLITLDQGGHLWVPALVCCALYVLVARVLADPLFVNAIVGGVTMTGLLLLADQQVDRLWEIMAPSSFLVILGMLCIHFERAFPPEEGRFSRSNFGRAFFMAGHVVMGLGLIVLLVGRLVGRLYERFFVGVDWMTLPEVATQANLKLIAIALVLGATYSYIYSQLVVKAKGRYVGAALLTLVWAAIMVFDLLQVALTIELVMLLIAVSALSFGLLHVGSARQSGDTAESGPIKSLLAPVQQGSGSWSKWLNFATFALGMAIWCGVRFGLGDLGAFSGMFALAALVGVVSCWLAAHFGNEFSLSRRGGAQFQAGIVLSWLAVDAGLAVVGIELTVFVLILEMLVSLTLAIGAALTSKQGIRWPLAVGAEILASLTLGVGVFGSLGLLTGVQFATSHLGLAAFFVVASLSFGLASRTSGRLLPAILAALSVCAATWQTLLLMGVTRYVFILAMTAIGIVCVVVRSVVDRRDGVATRLANVSQWTGRLCLSTAGVATLLIALTRLLAGETDWPLLGLVATQVGAGGLAGLLANESGWRRHFWFLAAGQLLMSALVYNTLITLSFWQRGELFLTAVGLIALAVGFFGWYRETDAQDEMVSFNLALGSLLSAVPLAIGMLVQRFDSKIADWGWVVIHEVGVLSIGLLLLGAGVLCRIRWSTIVGGSTLLVYVVSLIGLINVPDQLQSTAVYMMVGGGLFFGTAVMLSIYRDRLLSIPQRMQNGEGVFRVLKWR